jgi:methylmalonyl-CoA mutase C-terminal domain/subunit
MTIFQKVLELMKTKGTDNVLLFGGGIIPQNDIDKLKKMGTGELFTPGTPTYETIDYVKKWVMEHRSIVS